MNWGRIVLAGVVGGICLDVANVVMHGFIMAGAYTKYGAFAVTEPANPMYFVLIDICIGLAAAILFAKTRRSWAAGAMGGLCFGVLLGLVGFWPPFYNSLVIKDFPYHLSWCWGGIYLIGWSILGILLGLLYPKPTD